jgi:hypothetical protein
MDTIHHWSRGARVRGYGFPGRRERSGRASSGPPPIRRAIVEVDVHDALDEDRPPHNRIPQAARTAGLLDLLTNRAGRPTSNDPADVMREDIGRSPVGGERQREPRRWQSSVLPQHVADSGQPRIQAIDDELCLRGAHRRPPPAFAAPVLLPSPCVLTPLAPY